MTIPLQKKIQILHPLFVSLYVGIRAMRFVSYILIIILISMLCDLDCVILFFVLWDVNIYIYSNSLLLIRFCIVNFFFLWILKKIFLSHHTISWSLHFTVDPDCLLDLICLKISLNDLTNHSIVFFLKSNHSNVFVSASTIVVINWASPPKAP